ncbi:MAG: FAD-dependent oxidoreductase, partial [Rikenellaceae bacterium]
MNNVIIVGGGFAGMQTALTLNQLGIGVTLFEREETLGGHVRNWHTLFPDMSLAEDTLQHMIDAVTSKNIDIRFNTEVVDISKNSVTLKGGEVVAAAAVVICSGYKLFDAKLKQEYGYGIYDKVITSADFEKAFKENKVEEICGGTPKTIAFVHCVGSRDQQVQQEHCSRVCCVTGVKQAIKVRKLYPDCEVYNFYMDIRMFGAGYEEMYRTAQQQYHIHFIRGRVSEVTPKLSGEVLIKTEDTLLARPMRISVDLLVLMIGMCAGDDTKTFAASTGITLRPSGFIKPLNSFEGNGLTGV